MKNNTALERSLPGAVAGGGSAMIDATASVAYVLAASLADRLGIAHDLLLLVVAVLPAAVAASELGFALIRWRMPTGPGLAVTWLLLSLASIGVALIFTVGGSVAYVAVCLAVIGVGGGITYHARSCWAVALMDVVEREARIAMLGALAQMEDWELVKQTAREIGSGAFKEVTRLRAENSNHRRQWRWTAVKLGTGLALAPLPLVFQDNLAGAFLALAFACVVIALVAPHASRHLVLSASARPGGPNPPAVTILALNSAWAGILPLAVLGSTSPAVIAWAVMASRTMGLLVALVIGETRLPRWVLWLISVIAAVSIVGVGSSHSLTHWHGYTGLMPWIVGAGVGVTDAVGNLLNTSITLQAQTGGAAVRNGDAIVRTDLGIFWRHLGFALGAGAAAGIYAGMAGLGLPAPTVVVGVLLALVWLGATAGTTRGPGSGGQVEQRRSGGRHAKPRRPRLGRQDDGGFAESGDHCR